MSVSDRPVQKGWIGRIRDGEIDPEAYLVFQYNPTNIKEDISPEYSMVDAPGSAFPTAVFKSVTSHNINFQLFFDATEKYTSTGLLAEKASLEAMAVQDLDPFVEGLGQFVSPPLLLLAIGEESWYVVATSVSFDVIRRNRELIPTRIRAELAFQVVHRGMSHTVSYYTKLSERRSSAERDKPPSGSA